jgi:hypothetical protein
VVRGGRVLERGVPLKVRCLYYLMDIYICEGATATRILVRVGCVDVGGQTARGGALWETLITFRCHRGGPLMGRTRPHAGGGSEPMYL